MVRLPQISRITLMDLNDGGGVGYHPDYSFRINFVAVHVGRRIPARPVG
jgi:uncharacterized protein YcbK (DUF882 family)